VISEKLSLVSDPDTPLGGTAMEFKLTYEGQLLGASRNNTRAVHKHEIRRKFHPQLKRLWEIMPALVTREHLFNDEKWQAIRRPYRDYVADNFQRCGYRFCPLVTDSLFLHCNLEILFLRADPPGAIIKSGDMDNRLKTIFDALRIPQNADELGGATPQDGEDPFFCLLEDDRAISNLTVETATLLEPTGDQFDVNDARLIISVKLWAYRVLPMNIDFM